jgi:hypothetical protein
LDSFTPMPQWATHCYNNTRLLQCNYGITGMVSLL